MNILRALCSGGLLSLAAVAGGSLGYLPAAGPTVLRFGPPTRDNSRDVLPPLVMVTPKPVDPDSLTNKTEMPQGWPGAESNIVLQAESAPAVYTNRYDLPQLAPEVTWPLILITNQAGVVLPMHVPPLVFDPPQPAPPSRASYRILP